MVTSDQPDLLSAFLAQDCDAAAFARAKNLSAAELLDFSSNPATQAHLTDLKRFTDQALALRTAQARITALNTLESVARSSDDPIERRRAAASILRNTVPVVRRIARPATPPDPSSLAPVTLDELNGGAQPPAHSTEPADDPSDHARIKAAPVTTLGEPIPPLYAHAPIRFEPSPSHTPDDVVNTTALALYTHRDPSCTRAIVAYLAPGATINNQPAPTNPRDLANLDSLSPRDQPVHHQHFRSAHTPDSSTHTIVLMHARARSTHYSLKLTRPDSGPHQNCWLIANLSRTTDTS